MNNVFQYVGWIVCAPIWVLFPLWGPFWCRYRMRRADKYSDEYEVFALTFVTTVVLVTVAIVVTGAVCGGIYYHSTVSIEVDNTPAEIKQIIFDWKNVNDPTVNQMIMTALEDDCITFGEQKEIDQAVNAVNYRRVMEEAK